MSEYVDFHYMPLEGKITGKQVLKQTEDAINDLGNKVYNLNVDQSKIDDAVEKSEEAVNTANAALSAVTTGRSVWFNTVAEMVATDIEAGVMAETKGYYVANDGGNALYLIRQEKSGDVVDGGSLIALDNGNMAELVTDGTVNVKQFGAIGNGTDDDTTVFQNTSSYAQSKGFVPFVGVATYKITSNVTGTFNSFGEVTITGGGTVDIINLQEVVSDVNDIRNEVVDKTASAKTYAENAQTSATNAASSASSASTTATQLMAYLADKETLTAPAVDPTLTISGAAADAKATGDAIKSTEAEMSLFVIGDFLWGDTPFDGVNSVTSAGVTYTPDVINKCVAVSGTSTGVSFFRFFLSFSSLPSGMKAGGTYIAHLDTDADVKFTIYYYKNNQAGGTILVNNRKGVFKFTIPAEATGMLIRIEVESGDTVNAVVRPFISEAPSLGELNVAVNNSMNLKEISNHTDLNDIKDTRCAFLSFGGQDSYINNPLEGKTAGIFRSYVVSSNGFVYQIVNEAYGDLEYSRRYNPILNEWSDWVATNSSSKAEMSLFGVDDLLWDSTNPESNTEAGVTKVVDQVNKTITLTGTATADTVLNFYYYSLTPPFPTWLQKEHTYYAHIYSDTNVRFEIREIYDGASVSTLIASVKNGVVPFKFSANATGVIIRLFIPNGTVTNCTVRPFISEEKTLGELTRETKRKSIKILSLGNSGHQDMLTYVPFIMKNVAPELDLTLGITYVSGASIDKQIELFDTDSPEISFDLYKAGADKWTIISNQTMKQCLLAEDWDIIMVGQASSYQMDFANYSEIPELIDKVATYVGTDHDNYVGHPVKFGYLGAQVRLANNNMVYIETPQTYPNYMSAVQQALNAYPLEFAIMGATAVMNARGTALAQYGDSVCYTDSSKTTVAITGQMAADYFHMQEGIGCMVGSYCSVLGILELAGINNRSIMGEGTRPDATWLTEHNIPGQNYGTGVVGISDANCLIAQKCAVMAHKKPFEISTIV